MPILHELFYAQSKNAFRVLMSWTAEFKLSSNIKELDEPMIIEGKSFIFELAIEIPKEMVASLFLIVDGNGFKPSMDTTVHFKEEAQEDDEAGTGSIADRENVA